MAATVWLARKAERMLEEHGGSKGVDVALAIAGGSAHLAHGTEGSRSGESLVDQLVSKALVGDIADLYDLEYVHDHDARFWLSLAERQDGPVVEWGAEADWSDARAHRIGHIVFVIDSSGGDPYNATGRLFRR